MHASRQSYARGDFSVAISFNETRCFIILFVLCEYCACFCATMENSETEFIEVEINKGKHIIIY